MFWPHNPALLRDPGTQVSNDVSRLAEIDWAFSGADTGLSTHGLHPYPAKFIPQIPAWAIEAFSSPGDTVLDPFCGSGTALVEALRLGRHAIGVDANPLACLISRAKTARLTGDEIQALNDLHGDLSMSPGLPLFAALVSEEVLPRFDGIDFWFDSHVAFELAAIKRRCLSLPTECARDVALAAFSSIIVSVSRQDSDTRYVRRAKNVVVGDTTRRFARALRRAVDATTEFSREIDASLRCSVVEANALESPVVGAVDLVVTSPPYPNAYSYHLYHRTRMLWLDMDQPAFKAAEIGSHRKYSAKGANAATKETFSGEMLRVFLWLHEQLAPQRYACFIVGDSTVRGEAIRNDELLINVATQAGLNLADRVDRRMNDEKKAFNPRHGSIKVEHVLLFQNGTK